MDLVKIIIDYYLKRGLKWPNFSDAMKFVATEIGEIYELDLMRPDNGWVRNNNKEVFSRERLSEELGDAIMMLIVAGISEGVDPVQSLIEKINKKLAKLNDPKPAPESPNNIPDETKVVKVDVLGYFTES